MKRVPHQIRLPRPCSSWLQKTAHSLWLVLSVAGCSFGAQEDNAEQNVCQADADCATQHCEGGRCVAEVEAALPVTLIVTPKRMPNGAQVQSIVSESFNLNGGTQDVSLRVPVTVPVNVRYQSKPLTAQATFTPTDNTNRFLARTSKTSLLGADKEGAEPSNSAPLLDGMTYRVLIQPTDSSIPPHSLIFTAASDASLDVDYADFADKIEKKKFLIANSARTPYQVRAVAETTGAPISTTSVFTGNLTGRSSVELLFDDPDAAYRLEFTPVNKQSYSTGVAGSCGDDSPQPKLSVPSRLFMPDTTTTNRWYVDLPELHDAVEYSGVISLCSNQKLTGDLQVSLTTQTLYLASGDSEAIAGEFETAAAASWDADTNKFRFCARVPPGSYTVKVTPGASLNCEIFAEKRLLRPEWSGEPDELSLRMPATLTANVLTPERMPMPKATVNAIAFASGELMRAPEDRSVANYNRSGSVATGADGSFTMSVDRGRYDVFIKPPATSNYAWRVLYDVAIASSEAEFATEIVLTEPVAVTGRLQYMGGSSSAQQSLADAEVRAYTLVDGEGSGAEQRSVEIGSGTADASGVVTLLLPPSLQHSWNP
jgi:hypothetical protein